MHIRTGWQLTCLDYPLCADQERLTRQTQDATAIGPSDDEGVPSFSWLQRGRAQCRRPGAKLLREVPVRLFVFDILMCDGEASCSYVERRDALITRIGKSGAVQVPRSWADVDPADIFGAADKIAPGGDCLQAAGHRIG